MTGTGGREADSIIIIWKTQPKAHLSHISHLPHSRLLYLLFSTPEIHKGAMLFCICKANAGIKSRR